MGIGTVASGMIGPPVTLWIPVMIELLAAVGVIFISLVLQSLPFILVGVLASAAVQIYLSDQMVARWLPRGRLSVVVLGGLLGMVVPACDCGAIPMARRLVLKGVPVYGALAFILAAPVVNPIVILTTFVAFQGDLAIVGWRVGMSFGVAVTIGLLASYVFAKRDPALELIRATARSSSMTDASPPGQRRRHRTIVRLLGLANDDFLDVIPFVIIGSFVTASIQTFVPREDLVLLGSHEALSIAAAMPLASILSVCSQADAFIARAFADTFTPGAIVAFMVIGQIVDLRNGALLLRTLGVRYVILVGVSAYVLVFAASLAANLTTFAP